MATMVDAPVRSLYVTGLRNAHALEKEALNIIDRQLDRTENFPEVSDRLRIHRGETEQQIVRLEEVLGNMDESTSGLKDAAMAIMGNMGAIAHAAAEDEVLKNAFANCALENFEIASYTSLITMAEMSGNGDDISALQQSLREEQEMARWCEQSVADITRRYVELRQDPNRSSR